MSKIFRMRPERCSLLALDWVMTEQLQFVIRALNARLSDPAPIRAVWPGSGSCQGSPTASRRKQRGLDTSLSPRPVSPPCGECAGVAAGETSMPKAKTWTAEVMVEGDMGSLFRLRRMRRNG
jgi:hypothetical protein